MRKRTVLFLLAANLPGMLTLAATVSQCDPKRYPRARGAFLGWTSEKRRRELRSTCTC